MVLDRIVESTKERIDVNKSKKPLEIIAEAAIKIPSNKRLHKALSKNGLSLIAEIKKASPSKGLLSKDFNPVKLAKAYESAGASAVSVLTEPTKFSGSTSHLKDVVANCALPVLQKDFFIDEYQVYESRSLGASAVLLIVAILSDDRLKRLKSVADELGMDAIVEVHTDGELDRAINLGSDTIGINNRNLKTLTVNLDTSFKLFDKAKNSGALIVSESGIEEKEQVKKFRQCGFDGVLVGGSIVSAKDPGKQIEYLLSD